MFIRVKKINGINYAYLVENVWTPKGSRQNVTAYLGKVVQLQKKKTTPAKLTPTQYTELINQLLESTLLDYGFIKQTTTNFCLQDIIVDLKHQQVTKNNKPAILALEQGHLCEHTIAELIRFSKKENPEKTAIALASALLAAGITVSTENMVALYESIQPNNT
ncbi:MAG: hypothetical protein HY363_05540 [Candidatus Aenigmarchaeota archaeon]|nr:hypothetical protein [Candidatus Aenigmarchaeota archaeon]